MKLDHLILDYVFSIKLSKDCAQTKISGFKCDKGNNEIGFNRWSIIISGFFKSGLCSSNVAFILKFLPPPIFLFFFATGMMKLAFQYLELCRSVHKLFFQLLQITDKFDEMVKSIMNAPDVQV